MTERGLPRPLDGVRIVDFTRVLAGPLSTALLADLGAEVIKIEPPQGDDYRAIGPFRSGESALFTIVNRGKRSVVLDLKQPAAQALARELIATADVVVENFRPGVAARLGIGATELLAAQPRLVYVSVSGYGQTGPLTDRPAYDIIMQATTGLMAVTGDPAGEATVVGEVVSDVVTGLYASWAILAALLQVERTGRGQHVDVAMYDATIGFLITSLARHLFTGIVPTRVGNRHPLSAPFGVFQAQDGPFVLAILTHRFFAALAEVIQRPDWVDDPRYRTDADRLSAESELRAGIEAWSRQRTVAEVCACLDAAGVPAAPIGTLADALQSPQAAARELLQPVDDPRLPGLRLPVQPVKFTGSAPSVPGRAPALGEHSREIIATLLGLGVERVEELTAAGIFGSSGEHA
jgi:CoA:oxalate CoA-transferase